MSESGNREKIQFEEWEAPRQGQDVSHSRRMLEALSGQNCLVLINRRFDASQPIFSGAAIESARVINSVSQMVKLGDSPQLLLSDGNFNHAVTLVSMQAGPRFVYWDPWPPEKGSFLQEGKNSAGVRAERVDARHFSVDHEELCNVIVAAVMQPPAGWARNQRQRYESIRRSDLFSYFHLHEIHRSPSIIRCKPGSFQEYIDIDFQQDEKGAVDGASVQFDVRWILTEPMANVFLAADLMKSLLFALDPECNDPDMIKMLAGVIAENCKDPGVLQKIFLMLTRSELERVRDSDRIWVRLKINCNW